MSYEAGVVDVTANSVVITNPVFEDTVDNEGFAVDEGIAFPKGFAPSTGKTITWM